MLSTDIVIGTGDTATTVAHTTITTVVNTPTDPTICVDCPAGSSSEAGSSKCQPCEAGTYSNIIGQACKSFLHRVKYILIGKNQIYWVEVLLEKCI